MQNAKGRLKAGPDSRIAARTLRVETLCGCSDPTCGSTHIGGASLRHAPSRTSRVHKSQRSTRGYTVTFRLIINTHQLASDRWVQGPRDERTPQPNVAVPLLGERSHGMNVAVARGTPRERVSVHSDSAIGTRKPITKSLSVHTDYIHTISNVPGTSIYTRLTRLTTVGSDNKRKLNFTIQVHSTLQRT